MRDDMAGIQRQVKEISLPIDNRHRPCSIVELLGHK
jgi:hypothetical protein